MRQEVAIIGAGGQARHAYDIFDACNARRETYDILGYIVDQAYGLPGTLVNGMPILGDFSWLAANASDVEIICAVGAPELRQRLVARAGAAGARFCNAIHPAAVLTRWVEIGQGVIIGAGCVLSNQVRLGHHVHLNTVCSLGHDTVLDEFATLAPGVNLAGNVTVATGADIGTGANIIPKIKVGAWSIIGAGSAIVRDVPPNTTVVGVPGRIIKTRLPGWHLEARGN